MSEALRTSVCEACGRVFTAGEKVCPFDRSPLHEIHTPPGGDALIGTVLGGAYLLLERLGEGGMGVVYRARQTRLQRNVALKLLRPRLTSDPSAEARFRKEALLVSQLSNSHTVSIHDFGSTEDGLLYLVMQLIEGESLRAHLHRGPLPMRRAISIAAQVCESLAEAHARKPQLIHRDIKPDNILIGSTTDGDVFATVLDFGLAQMADSERMTISGLVVGTPTYMAPEQARNDDRFDHRIDLYALGAVLHEMISGRAPFSGRNVAAVLYKHIWEAPPPLSEVCIDAIPAPLERVVLDLLAKNPEERPATALDARARFLEILATLPPDDHAPRAQAASATGPTPSGEIRTERSAQSPIGARTAAETLPGVSAPVGGVNTDWPNNPPAEDPQGETAYQRRLAGNAPGHPEEPQAARPPAPHDRPPTPAATPKAPLPRTEGPARRRPFNPLTATKWPDELPSSTEAIDILAARAGGGTPSHLISDAIPVEETWKSVTSLEAQALSSIAEETAEEPASETDATLSRISGLRLRARIALSQADQVISTGHKVRVDDAEVSSLSEEFVSGAHKSLDAILKWTVTNGDPAQAEEIRSIRMDLTGQRKELERAAARLHGDGQRARLPAHLTPSVDAPGPVDPGYGGRSRPPNTLRAIGIAAFVGLGLVLVARHFLRDGGAPFFATAGMMGASTSEDTDGSMGAAAGGADASVAGAAEAAPAHVPLQRGDCGRLASPNLRAREPNSLRLQTTILSDRGSSAIVSAGGASFAIKVGDYVGSHCWKVSRVGDSSLTLTLAGEGGSPAQSMTISR